MISFIIPAYNEERLISSCIESIHDSCIGIEYEIIVADNNSTDATNEIATISGCRVVKSNARSISGVRNDGARVATGTLFIFVDADTEINKKLIDRVISLKYIDGGGALLDTKDKSLFCRLLVYLWRRYCKNNKIYTGSFIFIKPYLFKELGGFIEDLYLCEDIDLSVRMNEKIINTHLIDDITYYTSARKLKLFSIKEHIRFAADIIFNLNALIWNREACFFHYTDRR